jgi:hypothetical protein
MNESKPCCYLDVCSLREGPQWNEETMIGQESSRLPSVDEIQTEKSRIEKVESNLKCFLIVGIYDCFATILTEWYWAEVIEGQ